MPAPIELSAFSVNPQVSSLDFNTSAGGVPNLAQPHANLPGFLEEDLGLRSRTY